ncbi:uncharacterized protein LOC126660611 [Mercurialis annua]|uniref:uncharacterized protein LOC126660611 n=1 Tax=Mercurialis annua TaxID=3986 RepID=UPI00215F21A5|nr:uncharacterized protein LOC126660611 [Mercurialis annua]
MAEEEEGSRRRLPNWMINAAPAASSVKNETNHSKKNKKEKKIDAPDYKRGETLSTTSANDGAGDLSKRKRKSRNDAVSGDHHACDLTVKDLVTIAEEYVMLDNNNYNNESQNPNLSGELAAIANDAQSDQLTLNVSTGDAAQDMLHLLLGPLLTNPLHNNTPSFTSDHHIPLFSDSVAYQNHNDPPPQMLPPTITKKKSSLKDKVSLFFD